MDLKPFFRINVDLSRRSWEFYPGEGVNSTRYSVSFGDAPTEVNAWEVLALAVQKSPEFSFKKINFINIPKDLPI